MSHQVFTQVIRGTHDFVKWAERDFEAAIAEHGEDLPVEFPETGYALPMSYALLGVEPRKIGEMRPIGEHCKEILPSQPTEKLCATVKRTLGAGKRAIMTEVVVVNAKNTWNSMVDVSFNFGNEYFIVKKDFY